MNIEPGTIEKQVKIQRIMVDLPCPWKAGHTLTDSEAEALSSFFHYAVRNNVAGQMKEAEEVDKDKSWTSEEVQALANKFIASYEVGQRQRRRFNPIRSRAISIAISKIHAKLVERGSDPDAFNGREIRAKAIETVEANPAFMELAKKQIEEEQSIVF